MKFLVFRSDTFEPNFCRCKMHVACSRNAIYHLNELDRDVAFDNFLKEVKLYFLNSFPYSLQNRNYESEEKTCFIIPFS